LKALMRAIDRFCLKHRRFGLRNLMLYIVIGYAAVYLLSLMDPSRTVEEFVAFNPARVLNGEVWRLVTWVVYTHEPEHYLAAIMLYFYYFIGSTLEREWGTPKFTIYYLIGILTHVVFALLVWAVFGQTVFIDSSYLNLSMFFAFAVFYPDQRVLLFFFIPIKIKWLALVDAAFFVFSIVQYIILGRYAYILVPIAAIMNFLIFCLDDLLHYLRPYKTRASGQSINFRRAAKQKRREEASRPFRHKCSVCGKTDADHPDLEFRYCSKCNGYHCFCIDHINNHGHFK
jgi:membrane associated rhomboid family serine protease